MVASSTARALSPIVRHLTASGSEASDSEEEKEEIENPVILPTNTKGKRMGSSEAIHLASFCDDEEIIVTIEDVLSSINEYIDTIPAIDGYRKGEIKIHIFGEDLTDMTKLIGAGTAVLDAVLYNAVSDSHPEIFDVSGPKATTGAEVSAFISRARGVFISWCVLIMCRGSHPESDNTSRPLPAICSRDALAGMNIGNEQVLALECSSAPLKKFPASVLLQAGLSALPPRFYQRIAMAPAGCRAIRYAVLAANFPRSTDDGSQKARDIMEYLIEKSGNRIVQLNLHPLADLPELVKIPKFTLKMTRAIMEALSADGRASFVDSIMGGRMESFKKDVSFARTKVGRVTNFSVLSNVEAAYDGLTLENIKNHCEYKQSSK
jgi:hypothetical protein